MLHGETPFLRCVLTHDNAGPVCGRGVTAKVTREMTRHQSAPGADGRRVSRCPSVHEPLMREAIPLCVKQ